MGELENAENRVCYKRRKADNAERIVACRTGARQIKSDQKKQTVCELKNVLSHRSVNVRVETASDAKDLLLESRGNMNRYKRYTTTKYTKGFEMHPNESNTINASNNNLPHIKWKDWSNRGNNGRWHIFFDIPN